MNDKKEQIAQKMLELVMIYRGDHLKAKAELTKLYPEIKWDELITMYLNVSKLADSSYDVADNVREKKLPNRKGLKNSKSNSLAFLRIFIVKLFQWGGLNLCGSKSNKRGIAVGASLVQRGTVSNASLIADCHPICEW